MGDNDADDNMTKVGLRDDKHQRRLKMEMAFSKIPKDCTIFSIATYLCKSAIFIYARFICVSIQSCRPLITGVEFDTCEIVNVSYQRRCVMEKQVRLVSLADGLRLIQVTYSGLKTISLLCKISVHHTIILAAVTDRCLKTCFLIITLTFRMALIAHRKSYPSYK